MISNVNYIVILLSSKRGNTLFNFASYVNILDKRVHLSYQPRAV